MKAVDPRDFELYKSGCIFREGPTCDSELFELLTWKKNQPAHITINCTGKKNNLVRNSCVIKVFGGVFMLLRCFLDCSVGVWIFVTGLSQISSFFYCNTR